MKLTIGFSPCPNDTFIFDALVNKKINTGNIEFELVLEDVQTLNEMAIAQKLDITKISYGSLPLILENYAVLSSGSALGNGVGPLLIAPREVVPPDVKRHTIAIPGEHTTAHVLFSLAYPDATNKVFLRYNEIEDFVLNNNDNLGVIIHENRFTYRDKGLFKITDLGNFWEQETGLPIPLGGIVARRNLPQQVISKVQSLIRESLEYSYAHDGELSEFVKTNSQEMSEEVMRKHIDLYVNKFSIDLGEDGKGAIKKFLSVYCATNKIPVDLNRIFLAEKGPESLFV
ncbi:MAG: 1,4-dihydroxy-6-naphthoate synthase [Chitinophagaceae bacterium]|nr:1,4-dihydroxy-6-naphthoate synthase [Chitinophagaceae bacterium]